MLDERLREARARKGLTQEQLAQIVGLHPLTISHFECRRLRPSLSTLLRLEKALGLGPGDLLRTPSGDAA